MTGVTGVFWAARDGLSVGIPDDCCTLVAGAQHGCISWRQALRCGLSPEGVSRRQRSGRWRRVLPRVYVVRGTPETWEQRLFAATLWGGAGVAVSGASAGALWGFPGFSAGPVEIALPGGRRSRGGVVVRRAAVEEAHLTRLRGLPVTTAARTLVDVAGRLDRRSFDAAFHHCLHERSTDLASLRDVAERRSGPGFAGAGRVREALALYAPDDRPAESPLEARCARLLARCRLPAPRRQHEVRVAGRRRALDFAWPDARVALEVDGYRWHSSRDAWENDRARSRELRRAGWKVVHATHDDLEHGFDRLVDELAALIAH